MIGKTLGHYRIIEKIGAGGMGEVYRAQDEHLQRDVAIKVLPSGVLADPSARKRFRQEALAASRLSHPNIGMVHDFATENDTDYLVMEFIPGQTLGGRLEAGPIRTSELVGLGLQMAEGLAAAHDHGIVHRDLKPGNLLLTPDGRLKILDFGLAKLLEPAGATAETASITETKGIAGTLPYMSPEQLRGEPVDARSDIHSAGAILYEMASGRRPYVGNTGPNLTDAILHQTPMALHGLDSRLPSRLEEIIFKCLEKDPGLRYQSARELAIDLRRLSAPSPPTGEARRFSRRRMVVLGASLAGVLALAAFVVKFAGTSRGLKGPRLSTGALASKNREANEYFEKAMLFMSSASDLPRARQMLERALALEPDFAAAQAEYGFTHLLMIDGGWSNDSSWLYRAEAAIRRVLRDAPDSSRAHAALAAVYLYQGRKELAPAEAEKALSLNPGEIDGYNWLLNYQLLNEDLIQAKRTAEEMLARAPLFFPARMNYGEVFRQQGDTASAIREQDKVLELDPQNVYALRSLTRVYVGMGDLAKARQTLERVRPADRQNFHVRLAWAVQFALEGNRSAAIKEMDQEVLKYAAVSFDEIHAVVEYYAVLGETAKAIEWLDRAVRIGDERAALFRRDRWLADIREQPRFKQILESIAFRRQQR